MFSPDNRSVVVECQQGAVWSAAVTACTGTVEGAAFGYRVSNQKIECRDECCSSFDNKT